MNFEIYGSCHRNISTKLLADHMNSEIHYDVKFGKLITINDLSKCINFDFPYDIFR